MKIDLLSSIAIVVDRMRPNGRALRDWAVDRPYAEQIQTVYRCVLDRAADPEGLVHWTNFLAGGGAVDKFIQSVVKSDEFLDRLGEHARMEDADGHKGQVTEVQAAYRCLLGRDADPEGRAHWVNFMRSGGSLRDLLLAFVRSSEFARRLGESPPEPTPATNSPESLPGPSAAELPPTVVVEPKRNRFAVVGNCQAATMMYAVQALTGSEMPTLLWGRPDILLHGNDVSPDVADLFARHEKVFMQPAFWNVLSARRPEFERQVVLFPSVAFAAYHPDIVYVWQKSNFQHVYGPFHDYQSSIALLGWQAGLSVSQTLDLFNSDVFGRLGFFEYWQPGVAALMEEGRAAGMDLSGLLDSWIRRGNFMYSMNHPSPFVILEIAKLLLEKHRIRVVRMDLRPYLYDLPAVAGVWPVYPEIGKQLGVPGHYTFKLGSDLQPDQPLRAVSLKKYLEGSFEAFSHYGKEDLDCDRLHTERYRQMLGELRAASRDRIISVPAPVAASREGMGGGPDPDIMRPRMAVLGNAQAGAMARCLQALLGGPMPSEERVTAERLSDWESGRSSLAPFFAAYDKVFIQPWIWNAIAQRHSEFKDKVVVFPSIAFMAFHPDFVDVQVGDKGAVLADGPLGKCHSSLTFLGWSAGLNVAQTVALFRRDVLQRLGFFDYWRSSELALLEEGRAAGLPLDGLLARWKSRGCFMHMPPNPKLFVIADIAKELVERLGMPSMPLELTNYLHDPLSSDFAWPVYPEIGEALGCPGSYDFKQRKTGTINEGTVDVLALEEFVEQSFAAYARCKPEQLACRRLAWQNYRSLFEQLKQSKTLPALEPTAVGDDPSSESGRTPISRADAHGAAHPYAGLPEHRFWRKAIQGVPAAQVDPIVSTKFKIGPHTKVATAGSCFALNISRRLIARGYNFLQTEASPQGPDMPAEGVGGMGLFSARFGYLYTARQLRQLMDRAYGRFTPMERAWTLETGRLVDPFRPRVEPDGFGSVAELEQARARHLAAVRTMFESLDVFVFTLGLTEAWRARSDGAVFSVAPGVAGGKMDPARYEFVNFTVAEVDADLQAFIQDLLAVNPAARLILTVSPVPILATYEDRHVLVASTYTKSVLRVAADQIARRNSCCDYFPGYELVNGSFHRGSYIAEDLRSVTPEGIDHVMRLFFEHYSGEGEKRALDVEILAEARKSIGVVCDEELLEAAIR